MLCAEFNSNGYKRVPLSAPKRETRKERTNRRISLEMDLNIAARGRGGRGGRDTAGRRMGYRVQILLFVFMLSGFFRGKWIMGLHQLNASCCINLQTRCGSGWLKKSSVVSAVDWVGG